MWIAIDDATRANGTIRVVPKRFNENIPHKRDLESDHHIHCPIDENDAIHAELPAGGVLFFCYGTPHATGDNPTPLDRAGLAYHFLNVDYAPEGFFDSSQRRLNAHPHITGVLASDGVNEYGESMREAWGAVPDGRKLLMAAWHHNSTLFPNPPDSKSTNGILAPSVVSTNSRFIGLSGLSKPRVHH